MSIQNILVPNNLDLFCKDLTADTLNIDNVTVDNLTVDTSLTVIGTSAFTGNMSTQSSTVFNLLGAMNVSGSLAAIAIRPSAFLVAESGSTVFYSIGSLLDLRGDMLVNSSAIVTFNNTPTFNGGIILPNNTYSLTMTYSGDLSTSLVSCQFYRVGNIVNIFITHFALPAVGAGTYSINISSLADYQIAINSTSAIETNDNGVYGFGTASFVQSNQTIVISNGSIISNNFSGIGSQGLTSNVVLSYIGT